MCNRHTERKPGKKERLTESEQTEDRDRERKKSVRERERERERERGRERSLSEKEGMKEQGVCGQWEPTDSQTERQRVRNGNEETARDMLQRDGRTGE